MPDTVNWREHDAVPQTSRLELRGLRKQLGGSWVVDGVDLAMKPGESLVLLGPSGCGKTTTLRMIAGLVRPDAGEILLDGALASGRGTLVPTENRRLGMVFQSYAVWPHKNVFDNVAYGLTIARVPRADIKSRVERALAMVQLDGFEKRVPGELSGGQQQRVAVARAIVTEPSLLLLDEPLSNLDAGLRKEMRTELRELQRRIGMTSLYVTHDQEEALVLGDKIAVMNQGRIEQFGSPEEIYLRPQSRFVASFVGTTNLFEGDIVAQDRAGSRLKVATTLGAEIWARASPDIVALSRVGERVALSVRPEDLLVGADAGAAKDGSSFPEARLLGSAFLGNRYELRLSVNGHVCHGQARSLDGFVGGTGRIAIVPDRAWIVP